MTKHSQSHQGQRQKRIAEQIRQLLSEIFLRGELFTLGDFPVTVSEVRISPDLKNATAYVSPLGGGSENEIKLIDILENSSSEIRKLMAKKINLRYCPYFHFKIGQTIGLG